jgi:hypothetical protein
MWFTKSMTVWHVVRCNDCETERDEGQYPIPHALRWLQGSKSAGVGKTIKINKETRVYVKRKRKFLNKN